MISSTAIKPGRASSKTFRCTLRNDPTSENVIQLNASIKATSTPNPPAIFHRKDSFTG
jgi:hypothetical protein